MDMIDRDYLAEMRQWVGDAVLHALVTQAAENFAIPLADMMSAWRHGATAPLHDAAHRLKGAAASMGCTPLATAAFHMMTDSRPADSISGAEIHALQDLSRHSLDALRAFLDQAQEIPVPPNPQ